MKRLASEEIGFLKSMATQDTDYHSRQFREPYRSTTRLMEIIQSVVAGPGGGEAVDVGCGAGANIFHLSQWLTGYNWTGVDAAGEVVFEIGRRQFEAKGLAVELLDGDFYDLEGLFPERRFDLVLSIQALLTLPGYEPALEQLLAVTRGWLFITGLFSDFRVDARIEVMDYTWPKDCQGPFFYNVYDVERVRQFCEARGCKEFVVRDFEIDIDLPVPEGKGMGTYTRTMQDGRRLQFSGPLLQSWKVLGIRMGGNA